MTPKPKSPAVRFDTRVEIQSPPNPNTVNNLDSLGAVDLSNWTLEDYDWIGFTIQGSQTSRLGNQAGDRQTVEITMHRRFDLELGFRLKVLNGPWVDRYLYIQSIGFEGARGRTMPVVCTLAST